MLGLMIAGSIEFCDQIRNGLECVEDSLSFTYTNDLSDASIIVAEEGAIFGEPDAYAIIEIKKGTCGKRYAEQSILGKKLPVFPICDIPHVLQGMIVMVNDLMNKGKKIVELSRIGQNLGEERTLTAKSFQVFHDVQQMVYEQAEKMDGFETKMMCIPFNKVSGDFLVTGRVKDKSFVVIGDVTGHGYYAAVYASVITALVKSYFDTCPAFSADIYSLFLYLSKAAYCFHGDANDSSGECVLCEIDHKSHTARFCSFGGVLTSPIIVKKKTGKASRKNAVKVVFPDNDFSILVPRFGDHLGDGMVPSIIEEPYHPGDSILFYSDGFTEVFSKVGESCNLSGEDADDLDLCGKDGRYEYGVENIRKVVQDAAVMYGNSPAMIVKAVTQDVASYGTKGIIEEKFFEAKLNDDAMIFCIREIEAEEVDETLPEKKSGVGLSAKKSENATVYRFSMENARVGEDMSDCVDFILQQSDESELSEEERWMAAIAFEEAFVNVCKYAYGDGTGYIRVVVVKEYDKIIVHLFDRGVSFDPTKATIGEPEPLQVGGHGIRLMREYSSMVYKRQGFENHLRMEIPKKRGNRLMDGD